MFRFYVTNMDTELAVFEKTGKIAVINNSKEPRQTDLYVHGKILEQLDLAPMEMRWVDFKENL
jgi:1,3-beta-galactosyl-N-acetylhexosamine phosphorylase